MMDLVEIRRKANRKRSAAESGAKKDASAPVSAGDVASDAAADDAIAAGRPGDDPAGADAGMAAGGDLAAAPSSPAPLPGSAGGETADGQEGLDRLFSARNDFALATEEAYLKALDGANAEQAGSRARWLAFVLGREHYAVGIEYVKEIIKPREVTDIPRVPEYLLGVISLRGVIVPVFDLCRRLRLGEGGLSEHTRIIVCELGERVAGLMVDSISQVVDMNEEHVEPPPAILTGLDRDMVEGVGRVQGRMIILLDLEQVLNIEVETA